MSKELVEAIAKAMASDLGFDWETMPDFRPSTAEMGRRNTWRDAATVALSAIERKGFKVVPVEPLDDALGLADTIINRMPGNGDNWNLIQRYFAARSAMLSAAPKP